MMNSPAFGLVGLGAALAFWIVGGALLGSHLDGRFDTHPALTLVFLVLGLAIGFYDAYRRLKDVIERVERQRRRKGRE
jgi:F0F1-type ATP synthase assembly protein I